MAANGWRELIPPASAFRGEGKYPIAAYSEFMPPPRVGWKAYGDGTPDPFLFDPADPFGWHVTEFEEELEMRPGLLQVARQVLGKLARLLDGNPDTGLPRLHPDENPYWPPELAAEPKLPQERCLVLLPVSLSRTQDDKGRVHWTLFGNSEQGPGRPFWMSFFLAPGVERPAEEGIGFLARLLHDVYGKKAVGPDGLERAGFRILTDDEPLFPWWKEPLPKWAERFRLSDRGPIGDVRYLLTFRPFDRLPAAVRKAYLGGHLSLLPFPGSLAFWGVPGFRKLHAELPLALQVPLRLAVARHRAVDGFRVPQSGFLHEATAQKPHAGAEAHLVKNTYRRTHRWDKVLRDQDELALIGREEKLLHVLFSTLPDDIDLYDKPLARNVQICTEEFRLLLDGPHATPEQLKHAMRTVQAGGLFGYRFQWPAMRVGKHEVYWQRLVVAYRDASGAVQVSPDAPLGYMTAYDADDPQPNRAIELWPRLLHRPLATAALRLYESGNGRVTLPVIRGVQQLLDAVRHHGDKPLPRSLARAVLVRKPGDTLDEWFGCCPDAGVSAGMRELVEPDPRPLPRRRGAPVPDSLTYGKCATRKFEVDYWKTIAALAEGTFLNKNNADCIRDDITQRVRPYEGRQLDDLGDYLLGYYARKIAAARMSGKALAGKMPFRWRTDFDYSWMGGWLKNQEAPAERDIIVMIPGEDRTRAVILGDHYDTAYMHDRFYKELGGCGARLSACGADDNHSATAAMMLAAPILLDLGKKGQLGCDVWLVHLTGEEFPADCLGARALTQRLVEGTLRLDLPSGKSRDLSGVRIKGLYVSDMIAHNNDHARDIFQISPGTGRESFWLAEQAHAANEIWNESVPVWNRRPDRAGRPRGRRSPHGAAIPEVAPFLALDGQVRLPADPRSTVFNTDAQVFSDAGVPCVLFMENYDINRVGYHDTHDTMANIDLDYGAAVCAITIESVARAASVEPG
ncbi:MAG TPA: M28 family peptidase [Gemmataceae bacterium]|nr:M28 family peptidase [Gemmataceae bacterium]